ncbi:HD domain-containing protein [Microbacterium testaceum]|uniref:Cyanamide hydratase n=1 Tax=Microbacterium testaceum TaxID=2033 RepID=A0A4Y3QK77_MICTE|nr:HD domain-containing protein [Microbacterium testaceum]MDZ5143242.1 HD domain-containing protein [Microbacterium testaceum]PNW07984.1 cyanamide hydratase [Microbacterium testaceum]GEB44610.1 cyanamide hydratase [Microbacterium testaceum]
MQLADFPVPDTRAARGALALAREYQSPAFTAHALRSWLWAEAFAVVDGIVAVDHELLYVAAVLHDIGTVTEFDNHTLSYEHAGGHVGIALTAGAGWPRDRRERVLDVIVRHNWPSVDPDLDAEGYLLETATALDITGARPDALPADFVREVLAAYPRGTLAAEFGACVLDQAARKPDTTARRLVDGGVVDKLAAHPLERVAAEPNS